jgi:hypothetical protein
MGIKFSPTKTVYPTVSSILNELREKLQIDRGTLDEDMLQQPFLYMQVAEALVEAMSIRDAKKEELARVDAELAEEYRQNAPKDERPSDKKVTDRVLRDPRHIAAFSDYAKAVKEAQLIAALKEAFDQRGKMLRELGNLFVAGYFDKVIVKGGEHAVKGATAAMVREAQSKQRLKRK